MNKRANSRPREAHFLFIRDNKQIFKNIMLWRTIKWAKEINWYMLNRDMLYYAEYYST